MPDWNESKMLLKLLSDDHLKVADKGIRCSVRIGSSISSVKHQIETEGLECLIFVIKLAIRENCDIFYCPILSQEPFRRLDFTFVTYQYSEEERSAMQKYVFKAYTDGKKKIQISLRIHSV